MGNAIHRAIRVGKQKRDSPYVKAKKKREEHPFSQSKASNNARPPHGHLTHQQRKYQEKFQNKQNKTRKNQTKREEKPISTGTKSNTDKSKKSKSKLQRTAQRSITARKRVLKRKSKHFNMLLSELKSDFNRQSRSSDQSKKTGGQARSSERGQWQNRWLAMHRFGVKLRREYENAQQRIRDSVRKEQLAKADAQTWRAKLEKLASLHRERLFKQASILRTRLHSAEKKLDDQEHKTKRIMLTNTKLKGMINNVKEEARSLRVISEKKRESSRKQMHDKLALVEGELDKLRNRVVEVDAQAMLATGKPVGLAMTTLQQQPQHFCSPTEPMQNSFNSNYSQSIAIPPPVLTPAFPTLAKSTAQKLQRLHKQDSNVAYSRHLNLTNDHHMYLSQPSTNFKCVNVSPQKAEVCSQYKSLADPSNCIDNNIWNQDFTVSNKRHFTKSLPSKYQPQMVTNQNTKKLRYRGNHVFKPQQRLRIPSSQDPDASVTAQVKLKFNTPGNTPRGKSGGGNALFTKPIQLPHHQQHRQSGIFKQQTNTKEKRDALTKFGRFSDDNYDDKHTYIHNRKSATPTCGTYIYNKTYNK